jgi:hypothetical protein
MKSAPVLANQPIDITIPALPAQPLVTSSQLRLCHLPIHHTAAPLTLTIRVLIADDHPLVRQGLQAALAPLPEVEVVAEAATGQEAIREAVLHRPDAVVMDLQMPELNGIEAICELRSGRAHRGGAGLDHVRRRLGVRGHARGRVLQGQRSSGTLAAKVSPEVDQADH